MNRLITARDGVRGKSVIVAGDLLLLTILAQSVYSWNGQENLRSLLVVLGAGTLLFLFHRYCNRVLHGAHVPVIPYI